MADTRKYIQAQKFTLAVGISTTDTSITLTSFNFPDGTAISSSDLGTVNYGTLEPGTSREEQISFTGITSNTDGTVTLTGVTRGLGFGAVDTYSEQADLKAQHGSGSSFIISNTAAFYDQFVNKGNDETITGTLSVPTPTSGSHAATKDYVDLVGAGGSFSIDRVVQAGNAGESVAEGDLVYFDDTDNEWKKADASTATPVEGVILGIAQGAGSDGGAIDGGVLTHGLDSTQIGMTPGVKLYASDTPGAIDESAGTTEKVIGFTKSATELYFDPNFNYTLTSDEKAALAGVNNAPTASNPLVTKGDLSDPIVLPPQVVTFTSSGTWTKDTGLKYIIVEAVGGGGGGASEASGASGGGGGAGYFRKLILASALGATETVTIGAAGTAADPSGTAGGDTTFGAHATAGGGGGGQNDVGGTGGTATGGDINIQGQDGSAAIADGNQSSTSYDGAIGGSSQLGHGATWGNGGVARGYGAGGKGGSEDTGGGGQGTAGIVMVTEYYS